METASDTDGSPDMLNDRALLPRLHAASAPSRPRRRGAAGARSRKRPRRGKSVVDDDSDDEAQEVPPKTCSVRQLHTKAVEAFMGTLVFYVVAGLGRYLFETPSYTDASSSNHVFELYKKDHSVAAFDEATIRPKFKNITGAATVKLITAINYERLRSASRRMYVFSDGARLEFGIDGKPSFRSSTESHDAFFFHEEVVKIGRSDVLKLESFVKALVDGGTEAAWKVIDTRDLRSLIAKVAGRYTNVFLTLQARAFAGCADAEKWAVLLYSLPRHIGKTFLLRLLNKALGSSNVLAAFLQDRDRDAIAYRLGGDVALTRLVKRVEPARFLVVDELKRGQSVETDTIKALQNVYRPVGGSYNVRMATFIGLSLNSAEPWTEFANCSNEDAARILCIPVAEGVDVATAEKNARALSDYLDQPGAVVCILALLTEFAQTPVPAVGTVHDWPTLDKREKPPARGGAAHNVAIASMLQAWLDKHGARFVKATNKDAQLFRTPVFEAAGIAEHVGSGRGRTNVSTVLDDFIRAKFDVLPSKDAGGNNSWCYAGVALAPAGNADVT